MTITIKGLDHVVLRVADTRRAIQFYCDVLGCNVERRVESIGLVQLRAGASIIDLVSGTAQPRSAHGNMRQLRLRSVGFGEAAVRAHLQSHGIAVGEVSQLYGADGIGPSLYIEDPDGNTVELKGPPNA